MMIYHYLQPKTCQVAWQLQLASARSRLDSIHSIEACHLSLSLNQTAKFQDLLSVLPQPLLLARHPPESPILKYSPPNQTPPPPESQKETDELQWEKSIILMCVKWAEPASEGTLQKHFQPW